MNEKTIKHAVIGIAEEHVGIKNAIHIDKAIDVIYDRTGLDIPNRQFRKATKDLFREGYDVVSLDNGFFMAETVDELKAYRNRNAKKFATGFKFVKLITQRIKSKSARQTEMGM